MARVTLVKKAQQRYATVPVIDPVTGTQKTTPVLNRDGTQKVSKKGPVFLRVTQADKTRPLPNYACGKCGTEILPGQPYKWIKPKSGPYGGRLMVRCGSCPTWEVWEYSSSLSARIAQIENSFDLSGCESVEDVEQMLADVAEQIRELAQEKEEGAANIESGFGHETEQSQELADIAQQLNDWADEVENLDVPDTEEFLVDCGVCSGTSGVECEVCEGSGAVDAVGEEPAEDCPECSGNGQVDCPDCEDGKTDEVDLEEWMAEVESLVTVESPV